MDSQGQTFRAHFQQRRVCVACGQAHAVETWLGDPAPEILQVPHARMFIQRGSLVARHVEMKLFLPGVSKCPVGAIFTRI